MVCGGGVGAQKAAGKGHKRAWATLIRIKVCGHTHPSAVTVVGRKEGRRAAPAVTPGLAAAAAAPLPGGCLGAVGQQDQGKRREGAAEGQEPHACKGMLGE